MVGARFAYRWTIRAGGAVHLPTAQLTGEGLQPRCDRWERRVRGQLRRHPDELVDQGRIVRATGEREDRRVSACVLPGQRHRGGPDGVRRRPGKPARVHTLAALRRNGHASVRYRLRRNRRVGPVLGAAPALGRQHMPGRAVPVHTDRHGSVPCRSDLRGLGPTGAASLRRLAGRDRRERCRSSRSTR